MLNAYRGNSVMSLKMTQLMLHKFTVDENVDQGEISFKS